MEVADVSGCPGGLHCLLRPDSAGPILSVLHRFTLLHVHLGRGDDDPTCLVTQHCLPVLFFATHTLPQVVINLKAFSVVL